MKEVAICPICNRQVFMSGTWIKEDGIYYHKKCYLNKKYPNKDNKAFSFCSQERRREENEKYQKSVFNQLKQK